jgi:signal transduction histidine kinase
LGEFFKDNSSLKLKKMNVKMNNNLKSRLESLESLKDIPRIELNWLAKHGKFEIYQPGLIAPKGTKIDFLWIILTGGISVYIDRGAGPKVVNTELKSGSVTGLLPYSRLKENPGDLYADEKTELLSILTEHFPEMIHKCPQFTAHTVHMMIDRARIHNTSAMQDEKMISMGRMAAGLAHELNNPASVVMRDIKLLRESQAEVDNATQLLQELSIGKEQYDLIKNLHLKYIKKSHKSVLTPLQRSDFEDKVTDWLEQKQIDTSYAVQLAELMIDIDDFEKLLDVGPVEFFQPALKWIAANCRLNQLTFEIEQSTTQIYKLVEAVKKFTSMDSLAEKELINIESGINSTLKMLDAKTKLKDAEIVLEIENDLPKLYANGAALNQVWFNLLDNALDAIPDSGKIRICVDFKTDQFMIRFIDNGPGISSDKNSRIFDPFYTTKPPGKGTGLGLDLSRRIVRSHKGDIKVFSQEGETEFCVYISYDKARDRTT